MKAQTASMLYHHNGEEYLLNLIDTPGYCLIVVICSQSPDMSISAVKLLLVWLRASSYPYPPWLTTFSGVLLVVDAAQGIQAQTVYPDNRVAYF